MTRAERDEAAAAELARAIHRAWPARAMVKFAEGWSKLLLVALRSDPEGRAAVVAALIDDPKPAAAELADKGPPDRTA
ncbi:MAG TPA: hypothetical protein VEX41_06695 [Candidatus Eisenbacteria bacterium]|nr:hypothetical protein [Candidatus Eisenbacteria bacterium]